MGSKRTQPARGKVAKKPPPSAASAAPTPPQQTQAEYDHDRASSAAAEELVDWATTPRIPPPNLKRVRRVTAKKAAIDDSKRDTVAKEMAEMKKKYKMLKKRAKALSAGNNAEGDDNDFEEGSDDGSSSDSFESEEEDADIAAQRQLQSSFVSRGIINAPGPSSKRLRIEGTSPVPPQMAVTASTSTPGPAAHTEYAMPPPTHAAPPPMHAAPPSMHAAPPSTHTSPPSMHAPPPSTHAVPPSAYAAPPPMHAAPSSVYAAPPSTYAAPPSAYAAPASASPSARTVSELPSAYRDATLPFPQSFADTAPPFAHATPPSSVHAVSPGPALSQVSHTMAVVAVRTAPPLVPTQVSVPTAALDGVSASDPPYKDGKAPSGKPKAGDYEPHVGKIINQACHQYEVLLATDQPFPGSATSTDWATRVWADVCAGNQVNFRFGDRIERIITGRNSHARGGLRDKIRPHIASTYGFLLDGSERAKVANLAKLTYLMDRDAVPPEPRFHYENVDTKSRFAHNKLVTSAIKDQWFADASGPGIRYPAQFSPFRDVTLALVFTTIEYCLDQWASGHYNKHLAFSHTVYSAKYEVHLSRIREWCKINAGTTTVIRQRLYDRARRASGAAPEARTHTGFSDSARDRLRLELEAQAYGPDSGDDGDEPYGMAGGALGGA